MTHKEAIDRLLIVDAAQLNIRNRMALNHAMEVIARFSIIGEILQSRETGGEGENR